MNIEEVEKIRDNLIKESRNVSSLLRELPTEISLYDNENNLEVLYKSNVISFAKKIEELNDDLISGKDGINENINVAQGKVKTAKVKVESLLGAEPFTGEDQRREQLDMKKMRENTDSSTDAIDEPFVEDPSTGIQAAEEPSKEKPVMEDPIEMPGPVYGETFNQADQNYWRQGLLVPDINVANGYNATGGAVYEYPVYNCDGVKLEGIFTDAAGWAAQNEELSRRNHN